MLFLTTFGAALVLTQGVMGKEMAQDMKKAAELYDSGVMMDRIMMKKQVSSFNSKIFTGSGERTSFISWLAVYDS
jgi:hypothetical protein